MNKIPYAYAIGFIMYAMLCTRPDVSYALSVTSRYQYDPADAHWVTVKNILKYLRRTKDSLLIYGGQEELVVIEYTDASFKTNKDDFRSQYGYVFCLSGGAVTWKSSKQDTVADSTTEAEYIAASSVAKKAVWIKKFISELGIVPSIVDPIGLYCDNNGAIAQAKEPRSHQRSKHILWHYHLIRETIDRGDVKICRVPTLDNIVDPLTKPLAQQNHDGHTRSMGIRGSTLLTVIALKNKLAPLWKNLDKWGITSLGKGFYEFSFSSIDDVIRVRASASWNLASGTLKLFPWTKDFNPNLQMVSTDQV
ncbi:hypothetical protein KIW84_056822 [Lathyrus oleraceus]|uniref:Retrotransposon protein, putative, Ty1-copia subclass n=1 Tax=Pisum sativum TaxID=3888 RepID=A0A9D4WZC6_PEA|nr:hypothetical protein KIW84_056822 [Pisum sativum]